MNPVTLAAGCLIGLSAVASVVRANQPVTIPGGPARYHYVYHKEAKPLALDGSRLAVRGDEALIRIAAQNLHPTGVRLEAHPITGWWMITGFGVLDADRIEQVVAELAAADGVEFASPVFVDDMGGPMFVTPNLIVGFAPGAAEADREALIKQVIAAEVTQRDWMPGVDMARVLTRSGLEVLQAANQLAVMNQTLFAEPDMVFTGRGGAVPNDPRFGELWGLHNTGQSGGQNDFDMDVPEAWDVHAGSSAIINVVIDTGVDLTHPDLNLAPGNDLTGNNTLGGPGNNCDNHGTPVAGCIAARSNNSTGVAGVAPGCRVASARCFVSNAACDGSWTTQGAWTVNALNWAQSIGARVTNNSNGYGFTSAAIDTAYTNTRNAGIVHFASAGNDGSGSLTYPGRLNFVNGVAALNRFGSRASFSQFGTNLDYSAPGQGITSTDRQGGFGYAAGDYAVVDGTSFASPYASGVACLLLSRNSGLTPQNIEDIMNATCTDLGVAGYDTGYGSGLVNAQRALNWIVPAGDGCSSAVDVPFGVYSNTLVGAGNPSPVSLSCGSAGGNPDVWYRYVAPVTGTLIVHTCGTHDGLGTDTVLSLHNSCTSASAACNDDGTGQCGGADTGTLRDSYLEYNLGAGQAILIRVSKFGATAVGAFNLTIGFAAANDSCSNATDVSAGGTYFGHLRYTSNDQNFTGICGSSATNPDAWYRFTAPAGSSVRLVASTCGTHDAAGVNTGMDTVLSIHPACGAAAASCNDDGNGECGSADTGSFRDSYLATTVPAGQTVLIRASHFSTVTPGPFRVNISATPVACPADFNQSGAITVQDIFDYLSAYFTQGPGADFNNSGSVTVQDIFDYLTAYFGGCP